MEQKNKTRALTLSAVFSALTVVILYFASLWPTGQLALPALASFFIAAAVIESGILHGVYVYIAAAVLSLVILPDKTVPLLFTVFFGHYPVVKCLIEKLKPVLLQWTLKLAVFLISLTIILIFMRTLVFTSLSVVEKTPSAVIICAVGAAIFILYDYGYSKAIGLYLGQVSKYMKKGRSR